MFKEEKELTNYVIERMQTEWKDPDIQYITERPNDWISFANTQTFSRRGVKYMNGQESDNSPFFGEMMRDMVYTLSHYKSADRYLYLFIVSIDTVDGILGYSYTLYEKEGKAKNTELLHDILAKDPRDKLFAIYKKKYCHCITPNNGVRLNTLISGIGAAEKKEMIGDPLDELRNKLVDMLELAPVSYSSYAKSMRDGFKLVFPIEYLGDPDSVMNKVVNAYNQRHVIGEYTHLFVDRAITVTGTTFIHIEVFMVSDHVTVYHKRLPSHERDFRIGLRHALGNNSLLEYKKMTSVQKEANEISVALQSTYIPLQNPFDECYRRAIKTMANYIQRNRIGPSIPQYYDLRVRIETNETHAKIEVSCNLYGAEEAKKNMTLQQEQPLIIVESMDSLHKVLDQYGLSVNVHQKRPRNISDEMVLCYMIDQKEPRWSYHNLMNCVSKALQSDISYTHVHLDLIPNDKLRFMTVSLYRLTDGCIHMDGIELGLDVKDGEKGRRYRDRLVSRMPGIKANTPHTRLMDNPGDYKYNSVWAIKDRVADADADKEADLLMDTMMLQMKEILLANESLNAYYVHVNVIPYKSRHVFIEMHCVLCPSPLSQKFISTHS